VKPADGVRKENWASSDAVEGFLTVQSSMNRSLAEANHWTAVSSPNAALRQKARALHSRHSPQYRQEAWIRGY